MIKTIGSRRNGSWFKRADPDQERQKALDRKAEWFAGWLIDRMGLGDWLAWGEEDRPRRPPRQETREEAINQTARALSALEKVKV